MDKLKVFLTLLFKYINAVIVIEVLEHLLWRMLLGSMLGV